MDENHQAKTKSKPMARLRSWWPKIKQHPMITPAIIVAGVLVTALIAVLVLGYWLNWDWTGLGPYTPPTKGSNFQRGKTLWDWLQLLFIPVVLAVGGFWLSQIQKSREQESAEKRAQTDQHISLDNQRETALQAYIDKMSELLLKEDLYRSQPYDEKRGIARARTLTVLHHLGDTRKRSVLQFLRETGLINKGGPIVDLGSAEIGETDLKWIHLENADLRGVLGKKADLWHAFLFGANLWGADLHEANLGKSDLRLANLKEVNFSGADLREADLREANLEGADLWGANLEGAFLREANLGGANLGGAHFREANLEGADLWGANLGNADFSEAELTDNQLDKAHLREADLRGAKYNTKTMQKKDEHGHPVTIKPTQWPQGFDFRAAGASCVDC